MFNATDLLGQILQSGASRPAQDRLRHAMGPQGLGGSGSPLSNVLGQAMGQSGAGSGSGGMLGGLAEAARGFLGGRSGQGASPMAVGGIGALAGALLGGGGGAVKGAVGGGAMAMLGGLALQALQNWGQQGTAPDAADLAREAPLGLREPQGEAEERELQDTATLMLKAMISAAKADGEIDAEEQERILGKLQDAGADAEAQAFVRGEVQKPIDLDGLIRAVPSRQVGVEVYAASLLAIEVDTEAERDYLRRLAGGLGLEEAVVQRIHQALGVRAAG